MLRNTCTKALTPVDPGRAADCMACVMRLYDTSVLPARRWSTAALLSSRGGRWLLPTPSACAAARRSSMALS